MKAALVQYSPIFKDPKATIEKIEFLLKDAIGPLDLILFPELSLIGYCFDSQLQVDEFANDTALEFAKEIAIRWNSFVQIGYIRKEAQKYFNSVMLIDRQGNLVCTYDKHFLYEQDELWASEGQGFQTIDTEFGKVGFGICMDLNPKQFKAPFDSFEFANFHKDNGSRYLFLSMAWLFPGRVNPLELSEKERKEQEYEMINYWALRLLPMIKSNSSDRIVVFICNRTGSEQDTHFGGVSCCFTIQNGTVELVGKLSCTEEAVLSSFISI